MDKIIFEKVTELVENCNKELERNIEAGDRIVEDLGFDSIQLINLQVTLEDTFDFMFDPIDDDFSEIFYNIDSICKYLEGKKGTGNVL